MAFNENKPLVNSPLNSAEIRNNFQHLKEVVSKEHTWDDKDPTNAQHKLDEIKGTFTGSVQNSLNGGVALEKGCSVTMPTTIKGVTGNVYDMQSLLQALINQSHTHGLATYGGTMNCNCNCDCNCDKN